MERDAKIYVAGHRGLVGSALMRRLKQDGFENLLTATSRELDLRDTVAVRDFFAAQRPDYVFLSAAKVGGIKANMTQPAEFLYDNLMIQNNVIHSCREHGVKKLCFLGSSCIYPREARQPIREEYLLTGPLEPTNEGYALAKIAGLRLTQYYNRQYGFSAINPMPCNLYGTNDCFDLDRAHVLSALVRRFTDAKDDNIPEVQVWGTGKAKREFMHVDDAAAALVFLMEHYDSAEVINVGTGEDIPIKEAAELVAERVGYEGKLVWDTSKPDGMLRKCLEVSKIKELGFRPSITLAEGIDGLIREYKALKAEGKI